MPSRTIAISDVHGCSRALGALIALIEPRPDDLVVTLGDYVDRGPDSRGVLDLLIDLGRTCRLVPLLGNHDEMMREALSGRSPAAWFSMGGLETVASYGRGRDLKAIPADHAAFLRDCRPFYETETHLFAHANYDPDLAMDEQPEAILRWESLKSYTPGPHHSGKRAVLGHSSQKGGEVLDLGHMVCIDTYCHGGGWLTGLEVRTGETWQVDREGRPR